MKLMLKIILLATIFMSNTVFSQTYNNYAVNKILNSDKEPDGIVFEVISWDDDVWSWAAPMIKQFRLQLREKHPDLDIAVVSHGNEQFDLTTDKEDEHAVAFKTLRSLSDQGVNLHVCGTHSSWRSVDESEYVDFIDVSPSAPAQINDYIKLGYTHILLRSPSY